MILTSEEIARFLKSIQGWEAIDKKLVKEIKLKNFLEGVALIQKIAEVAEKLQHHPDLYLYDYRHLRISLSSHDAGGITKNDFVLATQLDSIF